jgi:hypothetical protein
MKKVLSIACLVLSVSYVYANSITKVSYCAQAEQDMLQVGVLELYFAQNLLCKADTFERDAHKATIQVQFSGVGIQPSDYATLNGIHGVGYQVTLRSNNKQHELVITYDPALVFITHAPTISIDMQHGLIIRFFDQAVLQKMRNQDKPILCVACL